MFIHLFRPLTHSPPYHPPVTQSPHPNLYPRIRTSPTHLEIQARYFLSKDLSLDVKKNDIYHADDSKRAYTMIVVNSITVTMFRRDVNRGL